MPDGKSLRPKCGEALPFQPCENALYYLMSQYAIRPSRRIAMAIVHHLELLTAAKPTELSAGRRALFSRLLPMWRALQGRNPSVDCGKPERIAQPEHATMVRH
ncbi:MAG: hypothetical protein LJE91_07725 [Gammaproteobacteria bacterium]|jgi:hypothetical protein|nr:hypothetical protein [Gammaproteobacteria bacterium]